jgi:hypothetical protein
MTELDLINKIFLLRENLIVSEDKINDLENGLTKIVDYVKDLVQLNKPKYLSILLDLDHLLSSIPSKKELYYISIKKNEQRNQKENMMKLSIR